jgi:hypothetical protein
VDPRSELVALLEERTRSHFERRKRRLQRIAGPVRMSALEKGWKGDKRVTREEWIVLHFGWVPEEREHMISFFESRGGHSRCGDCGRGLVSDGPYSQCPACGAGKSAGDAQTGETAR